MLYLIPKRITEMKDELRRIITADVYNFAYEKGVRLEFLHDSVAINDSIETIVSKTIYLVENTKLDTLLLEGMREMQKAMDKAEKKKVKK